MNYFTSHRFLQYLTNPKFLSAYLVLIGLGGLYFSTIVRNPYTILYPSALILGAVCFPLLKNRGSFSDFIWGHNISKHVLVGFFIVLSLLVVQYHTAGFWRTDMVFYLTFALYILTGSYIITGGRTSIALLLVCLVGLTNRITALYASREYVGVDIYGHSTHIQSIVAEKSLEGMITSKYFYAPFYHMQAAEGQLLFEVGTKDALTLTTMVSVVIVSTLVAFIITNQFWNRQVALLASLLYTGSDEAINWGVHLIPTSLGIAFFSISLFSLLLYYLKGDKRMFAMFIGSIAALMYTHQVSLLITATLVLAFSLAIVAYTFQLPAKVTHISLFTGSAVMTDFMMTRFGGPGGSDTFLQRVLAMFVRSLTASGVDTRTAVVLPADPRISGGGAAALANIQIAGSTLLLFFAILGALFWLYSRDDSSSIFAGLCLGVGVTVLLVFTLGFPIIGMRNLVPGRWWAFTYLLLVTLAAPGLVFFANSVGSVLPRPDVAISILLVSLLIPYVVLMGGAAVASADNPFINEGFGADRLSITDTEQALGEHIDKYDPKSVRIVGDFRYIYTPETVHMDYYDPESLASRDPVLVANREYMSKKQAMYTILLENRSIQIYGGVPIGQLNPKYRSPVYDTGGDELLWIRKS